MRSFRLLFGASLASEIILSAFVRADKYLSARTNNLSALLNNLSELTDSLSALTNADKIIHTRGQKI